MSSPVTTAAFKARNAAMLNRSLRESAEDAARAAKGAARARYIGLGALAVFALPAAIYCFFLLFPNLPNKLSASDSASMQRVLFGGEPALVLCENATSLSTAGPAAVDFGHALRVPAYRLDCSAPLGDTGINTFQRLALHSHWNPLAFIVAKGKLLEQLAPSFTDEEVRTKLAKRLMPKLKLRHTRVDNGVDLDACINGGAKGCVLAYSAKARGPAAGELAALVKTAPAATFALLNAAQRAFRTTVPELDAIVKDAVMAAKVAGGEKGKGTVLIALRRVAPALTGGDAGALLATVSSGAGPKLLSKDITALLASQATAIDAIKSAGGALIDAVSVAQDAGSTLVFRPNVTIALVVKKAAQKPVSTTTEVDIDVPPTEEEIAAARERELEVRKRMAEQERDSAHFAAAADGNEEEIAVESEGSGGGGGDEEYGEAEAVFDLDDGEL